MKKFLVLILALIMSFSVFGCEEEVKKIGLNDFEKLIDEQPLKIVKSELLVQFSNTANKRLNPDMMSVIFQNQTDKVIDYVKVAFVAWDKNGEPVKIKSPGDEKAYDIKAVEYKSLNLQSGRYFGKGFGIELAQDHNIASFRAIIASFKTKDGTFWENPYLEVFRKIFAGKQFDKNVKFECQRKENNFKKLSKSELEKTVLDEAALNDKLATLLVNIVSSEYIVTGEDKHVNPDVIKTTFKNIGEKEISSVRLAIFGFDENGKAVLIREAGDDASKGNYLSIVEYTTAGFMKDTVFGEKDLYQVDEACGIKYVKAVLKSYTDIDGNIVENPYFVDACLIYEGGQIDVKLPESDTLEPTE